MMGREADQSESPQSGGGHKTPRGAGRTDPAALQRVLREALAPEKNVAMDRELMAALSGVVSRHRGRPLELDPVAVELVEATVHEFLRIGTQSAEWWHEVSRAVAESMMDDPVCQERLESLWGRLCEGA